MLAKMIYCCMSCKDELEMDFQNKPIKEIDNMNYKNDEEVEGVLSLFPSIYIREDERKYIKFSKDSIINYLTELSQKNFINKYEENSLNLSILDKNELSNTPTIRCEFIRKKSLFKKKIPTLEQLIYPIIIPEIRIKWDQNFKEFELIRTINKNTHIARMVSTYQLTMIPEREIYDKRTFFFDNGVFYYFSSSIPDELYPPKEEPVRATNYIGALIIKEDNENFYIDSFNQVDLKMKIPEVLIVMSFPWKVKEFFDGFIELFNK
jgi:DNA-directed RNA polymerase subunit RPC12/RpoP